MSVLRDSRVAVLLALVLAGSVLSVVLALSRPEVAGVGDPPSLTDGSDTGFQPADLVGPGGEALAAAVTALPLTLSYDHRDLAASLSAATERMTQGYAAEFTRAFRRRVRPFAKRRAAVAQGIVRGAGVVRASDDDTVACLLYIDQVLVEARGQERGAEPEVLGRNRVRVVMVLRDGAWKIDGIQPL